MTSWETLHREYWVNRNNCSHKLLRVLSYPVFDSLDPRNRRVAGVISAVVYWRLLFSHILPPVANGIICVLSNSFNQSLTYRIDGSDAHFVGEGDIHDRKYDHLVHTANLNEYIASISSKATRSYTSVDLNNDHGRYSLHVYPSEETEAAFRDNRPILHTLTVFGVVLFTSLVFLLYDCVVRRRQKIVMDRAVASGAIVSSLFPDQVRDKLYIASKKNDSAKKKQNDNSGALTVAKTKANDEDSPVIADQYRSATVFFADIAGCVLNIAEIDSLLIFRLRFTNWCSQRSPEDVFQLLGT